MSTFSIRTYTVVQSDTKSVLYSPALPRPGVPYDESNQREATRLVIIGYSKFEPKWNDTLSGGELRISTSLETLEQLERRLLEAPKETFGKQYPYSVVSEPLNVEFVADNGSVVSLKLPI